MQRNLIRFRLILITPALFILLQLALALHHHHFQSYHDAADSLHSAPTACHTDHVNYDILHIVASSPLLSLPSYSRIRTPECISAPVKELITASSHSRAPPSQVHI